MRLNEINDNPGARKKRARVGRGIGSGMGKTSTPVSYTHLRAHET